MSASERNASQRTARRRPGPRGSWLISLAIFGCAAIARPAAAEDTQRLDHPVRCPSRPGAPTRIMSVRDQLISLAAHNAYHLGRIVLLRQLLQAWPPASGGFTW